MNDRALKTYEDWRARYRAGRPCPGLVTLHRRGLLAALRTACPRSLPPAPPTSAPRGRHEAALVGMVAALLRSLPVTENR